MLGEYLTLAELGQKLKIHPKTVKKWIEAKGIPIIRIGRQYRVSTKAVESALETAKENDETRS